MFKILKSILPYRILLFLKGVRIHITGENNRIIFNRANLYKFEILIQGENNCVEFGSDIKCLNGQIIIKGKNCHVEFGSGIKCFNGQTIIEGTNCHVEFGCGLRYWGGHLIVKGIDCHIEIGDYSTSSGPVFLVCVGEGNHIKIGKNCLFSDNIDIWASDTHSIFDESGKWINKEKDVIVGDNVWIGRHVKILKGVNIGNGSVIGMGTILTKDVGEKELVVGNPQRVIKRNITWSKDYPNVEEM